MGDGIGGDELMLDADGAALRGRVGSHIGQVASVCVLLEGQST